MSCKPWTLHRVVGRRCPCWLTLAFCTICLVYVFIASRLSKPVLERPTHMFVISHFVSALLVKESPFPTDDVLTQVAGTSTYILSAVAANASKFELSLNIFDGGSNPSFYCCVIFQDGTGFRIETSGVHAFHHYIYLSFLLEMFNPVQYVAKQITCPLPESLQRRSKTLVALTTDDCPRHRKEYMDIVYSEFHPGELAICAKVAYNDSLDAQNLVEWFELQRLLGVDKVLLFVMELPSQIWKVLQHYRDSGFLLTVPYAIPGGTNRSFLYGNRSYPQFFHDEQLAIFDCQTRLSGYSHVAALDLDEFIIPRSNTDLKHFVQEMTKNHPDAAGFQFHVQFHVTDWAPVDRGEDLSSLRYLDSTPPRWECQKYVYSPSRTSHARTHAFLPLQGYKVYTISPILATIHHFRPCPRTWTDCYSMARIRDYVTLRFGEQFKLGEKVKEVVKRLQLS